jgi:soluble lytic murein transglycosylase-like protein
MTLRSILWAAAGAAILLGPLEAAADIFAFTDDRGVAHFTNMPQIDKRYKLIRKEANSAPRPIQTSWMPSAAEMQKFAFHIDTAGKSNGVDAALIHAVISAESGYNPNAVSRKGASGLMQLMPDTAKRYGVANVFDPAQNIQGGTRYLKDLLAMFNGDLRLAIAGYNAGENAVIRAGRKVPQYTETVAYVPKVIDYYNRYRDRKG